MTDRPEPVLVDFKIRARGRPFFEVERTAAGFSIIESQPFQALSLLY
jgi:hypothetical protein